MKPTLTETFTAEAAVNPRRIVAYGTADNQVIQAASTTATMFGVADSLGAALGGRIDVHTAGVVEVDFGGTITRGGPITADANGKAVAAAPGAGVNARIIGFARVSGVSGDIGLVQLEAGQIQG